MLGAQEPAASGDGSRDARFIGELELARARACIVAVGKAEVATWPAELTPDAADALLDLES